MATETTEKPVMVIGMDESEYSFYALGWALDYLYTPSALNYPYKLLIVHAKPTPTSLIGFGGPGPAMADILPHMEADLKKIAARVLEKAQEICASRSVNDAILEVIEGDPRTVICDVVKNQNASVLVVGSHGYGAIKRYYIVHIQYTVKFLCCQSFIW
jgi:nucleotide-binding universal stress UspA family protein